MGCKMLRKVFMEAALNTNKGLKAPTQSVDHSPAPILAQEPGILSQGSHGISGLTGQQERHAYPLDLISGI
jgi:hypothetical protein